MTTNTPADWIQAETTQTPHAAVTDDYSNTTDGTGVLTVNAPVTGNIESAGDVDWFKITVVAGKTYKIDMEGSPTGAGTLSDIYIEGI